MFKVLITSTYFLPSKLVVQRIVFRKYDRNHRWCKYKKAKRHRHSLAPLTEQKRIVAKIEELLPYIDRYESAWTKLEDFNKLFPVDMQKSIFQYAIQGKLVEQRPEEGTGEDLYQQIQKEKQRLIKEGKIKKKNLCRKLQRTKFRLIFRRVGGGHILETYFNIIQEKL